VKRILVPVDRSEYKEKIAAYAILLGKAWRAELTAVHIIKPSHALLDGVEVEAKEQARIDDSKRQAENLLDEISILAKNKGLKIKKEAVQPSDLLAKKQGLNVKGGALEESNIIGKAIIDYAKKNNIDVIVIGTKGMSALEQYFFGSVANKVIREAHCPVFAIR
jgi:nucleotide-binding universal stress UspA family protein